MNEDQVLLTRIARHTLLLLMVGIAGCTAQLMPKPVAAPAIYLLEGSAPIATRPDPAGPTLSVSAMRAAAGFSSADMIYIEHAHQLQAFARHRWADSPARMLDPILVAAAEGSTLFANVAGAGSHAASDLLLDTELLRLAQVFEGEHSRIELTLRAGLIDSRSGRIIASQVFRVVQPVTGTGPYGGVQAGNRAVDLLTGELEIFLARGLKQWRRP